jgi:uncharacterized protein (DUF924 family)
MTDRETITPSDVRSFWFSEAIEAKWFKPDEAFDAALKARFEFALKAAKAGALALWTETSEGALALIVLLDQMSRNIYRNTAEAFAADPMALDTARRAIDRGLDASLEPEQRLFLYMPFMHSERIADQERGVELYTALGLEENLQFMIRHRDIIARFGRFPHRNAILGRQSTPEEEEFLKKPGSRF